MAGASGIAAAQARNRVHERERQLLLFGLAWRTTASDSCQWQLRARSTHSSEMEAALQVAHHLNGSNLRDTGHSSERSRMAVLAEVLSVSILPEWLLSSVTRL